MNYLLFILVLLIPSCTDSTCDDLKIEADALKQQVHDMQLDVDCTSLGECLGYNIFSARKGNPNTFYMCIMEDNHGNSLAEFDDENISSALDNCKTFKSLGVLKSREVIKK